MHAIRHQTKRLQLMGASRQTSLGFDRINLPGRPFLLPITVSVTVSSGMAHEHNNLSGVWQGQFSFQVKHLAAEFFTANLLEGPNFLGGSIHEVAVNGKCAGRIFYASVADKREGSAVIFTKTYETAPRSHQVYYFGKTNNDFTEIDGTWRIRDNWSGRFLMIRNNGQTLSTYKRIVEHV